MDRRFSSDSAKISDFRHFATLNDFATSPVYWRAPRMNRPVANAELRARIERLLRGDIRNEDLTRLFMFAGDHADGYPTIAEVRHFVAHPNRDKGIVTEAVRDWFAHARFVFNRFGPGGPHPYDGGKLPRTAPRFFRIAVDRIGHDIFWKRTRHRPKEARMVLSSVAGRLVANPDGTWSLPPIVTRQEMQLIECAIGHLVTKPAFTGEALANEMVRLLKSNGLVSAEELRAQSNRISEIVQLYGVTVLHNANVSVDEQENCRLAISFSLKYDDFGVDAVVPDIIDEYPATSVSTLIYKTNLKWRAHVTQELLEAPETCSIELNQDGRLVPLF